MGNLSEAMSKYKKENMIVRSWDDYGKELRALEKKVVDYVTKNKIIIDAVIPIERGGNFPGTYLAYKLNILRILPVQYKYFFVGKICELRRLLGVPKDSFPKNSAPVFLLVESNHCYGTTANIASKDLKKQWPKCQIIYAASNMDYNHKNAVEDAEVSFYGAIQNDCKELSKEQCEKLNIDAEKTILLPWENIEEEWKTVQAKQHDFVKNEEIRKKSELVLSINLDEI